ncbi:MAG: hypothetical protein CL912_31195 [Deltaproteobacteria bacterium]|nr:hypothetical protein [Deltaproteobacteria bacterium]
MRESLTGEFKVWSILPQSIDQHLLRVLRGRGVEPARDVWMMEDGGLWIIVHLLTSRQGHMCSEPQQFNVTSNTSSGKVDLHGLALIHNGPYQGQRAEKIRTLSSAASLTRRRLLYV